MKNMLENVAITTVVVLFLFIIVLIVQYNMVDDENVLDEIAYELPAAKKESKKAKTTNYLENLESYTDVDVKVDPTKANTANRVQVASELVKDDIGSAVGDTDKSSYVDSLENYANEEKEEKTEDDKVKLDQEEIVDEIGMAIGAALEDI
ncbi:MAG: hypothetical protein E3J96_02215 [Sulfurovum sp.]|nr:MAG: hypothetical protein E3J96_02215 [Sulfurovum sp.]